VQLRFGLSADPGRHAGEGIKHFLKPGAGFHGQEEFIGALLEGMRQGDVHRLLGSLFLKAGTSQDDGRNPPRQPLPEDVRSWRWIALRIPRSGV